MADTGFNWAATWTAIDTALTLTQGGVTTDTSAEIDLDGKAACVLSIDADYSNHAKATAGLKAYLLRPVNDTPDYEDVDDQAWSVELNFTQNGTNRITIPIDPGVYPKFKLYLSWENTTGSSAVTVDTKYITATIPAAS